MRTIRPPERITRSWLRKPSVFLCGSVEMGAADDWQSKVDEELRGFDGDLFNPRRRDWDSSWIQSIKNHNFSEQVDWELDHIALADFVFVNFEPETKAPITLMELGILSATKESGTVLVRCPPEFWRRGNVEIVCRRAGFPIFETMDEALSILKFSVAASK